MEEISSNFSVQRLTNTDIVGGQERRKTGRGVGAEIDAKRQGGAVEIDTNELNW